MQTAHVTTSAEEGAASSASEGVPRRLFMSETIGFAEGELKSRRFFRDSGTAELRPPNTAVNLLTTYS